MKPTEILKDEHRHIERMLTVLEKATEQVERDEKVLPKIFENSIRFIREFADGCHHHKEEKLLFPAMARKGFPENTGPIGVMLHEHNLGRTEIAAMDAALKSYAQGDNAGARDLVRHTRSFIMLLRNHIMKEDNILFVLADDHLSEQDQTALMRGFVTAEESGAACSTKQDLIALLERTEQEVGDSTKSFRSKSTLTTFLAIVLFSSFGVVELHAQDEKPLLQFMGNIRVRSEVDMRDFNQRTPPNTFTLLRTRLGLQANPTEDVRVFIQAQDSRVFGTERDPGGAFNTLADTKNLDMHQGFVEIRKLFADEITLTLGRKEMVYGNERMIGAVGWNNVSRSFDGGILSLNFSGVALDAFGMNVGEVQTYSAIATPAGVRSMYDAGYDFYGAYATIKSVENNKIDGYVLYQINRDTSGTGKTNLKRYTAGAYVKGKTDAVDYEAEVAFQGGKRQEIDVSAYLLAGVLGYSFEDCLLQRLAIGYEMLSGTPLGETKVKTFDPTFHTGHKFYGFMDYFINIPVNTGNRGLSDLIVRAAFSISEKFTANIWIHHFSLAQKVAGDRNLGQEVDIVAQYRHNKSVSFEIGTSAFIPDKLVREAFNGSDVAFWGYLQTSVSF